MKSFPLIKRSLRSKPEHSKNLELSKISRWNIRVKLVSIISSIILVILGIMIYLATFFFRNDYELKIQEQNLKIAEVVGNSLKFILSTIIEEAKFLVRLSTKDTAYLQIRKDILYIGRFTRNLELLQELGNQKELQISSLDKNELRGLVKRYEKKIKKVQAGKALPLNMSPYTHIPTTAIIFLGKSKDIYVIFIATQFFLSYILAENSSLIQINMLNLKGDLLVDSDSDLLKTGKNLQKLPIVNSMLKSRVNSGQIYFLQGEIGYLGSYWKSPENNFGITTIVREDDAFAEVYNIQRRNLYLLIVAISFAILAVFIYSNQLIHPIHLLTLAAKQISIGKYRLKLPILAKDEIGVLTSSFNNMSKGLQERENLKESFGRFVNKEIAERSLRGQLPLGGVLRDVALLFCDIRDFTSLSEKMLPEELVEFLNAYFSRMIKCLVKQNATVDKFIGDAIMAHWGAVKKIKNPCTMAVMAALEMRKALILFNADRLRATGKNGNVQVGPIHIGMGINYGPVVAGQIGAKERVEYTVIGDSVNLASRLESLTKEYAVDILISEFVCQEIKEDFKTQSLGKVKVRGKKEKVGIYAVLGSNKDSKAPKNIKELQLLIRRKEKKIVPKILTSTKKITPKKAITKPKSKTKLAKVTKKKPFTKKTKK